MQVDTVSAHPALRFQEFLRMILVMEPMKRRAGDAFTVLIYVRTRITVSTARRIYVGNPNI